MSNVEILGKPKYRSRKRSDQEDIEQIIAHEIAKQKPHAEPHLVYERDEPEPNQTS